ncbi:unnamed protein product, partial [Polarella glacialis]
MNTHDECLTHNRQCRRVFDVNVSRVIIAMLIAGLPCPDYSRFGKLTKTSGKTVVYLLVLLKMVHQFEPDIFLHENVPGFPWKLLSSTLQCKYHVDKCELDPNRHCGVPIRRERVYAVCSLKKRIAPLNRTLSTIVDLLRPPIISSSSTFGIFLRAVLSGLELSELSDVQVRRLNEYTDGFAACDCYDLSQNPSARARMSSSHGAMQTLTRGSAHIWSKQRSRFFHGLELLLAHGLPVEQK